MFEELTNFPIVSLTLRETHEMIRSYTIHIGIDLCERIEKIVGVCSITHHIHLLYSNGMGWTLKGSRLELEGRAGGGIWSGLCGLKPTEHQRS